jgi:hypothetical protein
MTNIVNSQLAVLRPAAVLQAGTSLESSGRSIKDIFESDIAPQLQAAPSGLFPAGSTSYGAFRRAADMVQTRAFHMKADNWLTGASQVCTSHLVSVFVTLHHDFGWTLTGCLLRHANVQVLDE